MSLYLSYIILYKNFFEKSKSRKNPVLESNQTYSERAEIHRLAAHYQPLSRSLVTVLPTKMLLEPLTIGYHIVQYGIFHLKSIFSLFIALLQHWGPHATSINNKIFRHLINKHSWRVCNHYRYPISPTHFAVGAPRLNTGILIPDQIYSPRTLQQTGEYVYWIDRRPYRKILLF